jgi:Transposase, Mutator family
MVAPYANIPAGTTGTGRIMPVTNALENLNREFRRRTKTQASFSTEASALTVLFGLVAVGQIVFRKIDGHQELAAFLVKEQWLQAA